MSRRIVHAMGCTRRRVAFLRALSLGVAAPLAAQCPDPPVPPGGFDITEVRDRPLVYADGAKTLYDVRYPAVPAGPCGWPVVMLVHGGGQSKSQMTPDGRFLAARGYFTVAYDVRGRGSMTANPPSMGHRFLGKETRLDTAEMVQHLAAAWPGLADTARLGMSGASQGGLHSWAAAAWSGKPLPPNSRGITTFPTFKAVYPMVFATQDDHVVVPQGKAILSALAQKPPTQTVMEPRFQETLRGLVQAQDFAGLAALWTQDPWRMDREQLVTSNVPTMVHVQWNDFFMPVERSVELLESMPPSTPTRAFLSPWKWHDDVTNRRAIDQSALFRWRWFDRFLKGVRNRVELEPRFVSAVVPPSLTEYQDPSTLLWNRFSDDWPPRAARTVRWYLRRNGSLDPAPPSTAEPADTVRHRVDPQASMAGLMETLPNTPQISAWFPLDARTYDGPVLTAPTEIAGSMRVALEVDPSGPNYQVHAAVYQLPASGSPRYLQSGVGLVRGDPAPRQLAIDVHDIRALLLPGDRLRLSIENVTRRPSPGNFNYWLVPYFEDVDIDVVHTAARPSWIEIPVMDEVGPALASPGSIVATRHVVDLPLQLESTARLAGSPYFLLLGTSGMVPGLTLPGGSTALLNVDGTTHAMVPLLNGPFLPYGTGLLDAEGTATPAPALALSQVPAATSLAGLRGIVLGVVLTPAGPRATNPLEWVFF